MDTNLSNIISSIDSLSIKSYHQKQQIQGASRVTLASQSPYKCIFCEEYNNPQCFTCKTKPNLTQNQQFNSFLNAIVDYKMGRSKAVIEEILSKNKQTSFQSLTFSNTYCPNISKTEQKSSFQKVSCEDRSSLPNRLHMKLPQHRVIHEGIQCDQCHQWPIIGIRYKCQQCQDYDLCSKCFKQQKHQHKTFHTILQPKRDHQKQRLRQSINAQNASDCLKLGSIITRVHNFFS